MPTDTLTLRVEERGAALTAKKVEHVGDEVRDTGKKSRKAKKDVSIFSRVIQIMGARAALAAVALGVLSVAGYALLPVLAGVLAGFVALGGFMIPMLALAAGVMLTYKATVEQAGSAASELRDMLALLKHAFRVAVSPAAAAAMRGFADMIEFLLPMIEALRPAMTAFGTAVGQAARIIGRDFAAMGPLFTDLIMASIPLVIQLAQAIGPLTEAFLKLAIIGMPWLAKLLGLFTGFVTWLLTAIPTWMEYNGVQNQLITLGQNLWAILVGLWDAFKPFAPLVGGALLAAWNGLNAAIAYMADHMSTFGPIIIGLIAAFAALKLILLALAAVEMIVAAAELVMMAPWIFIAAAIAGVIVALYLLYQRCDAFRAIVDKVVAAVVSWATAFKDGLGAAIDWLVPKITWLIDKLKWIWDHSPQKLIAKLGLGVAGKAVGGAKDLLGLQHGGTVTSPGQFLVGERGPEVVTLPGGANVNPGGTQNIHVTLVMPDGRVLAQQTVKAARKAQSVR